MSLQASGTDSATVDQFELYAFPLGNVRFLGIPVIDSSHAEIPSSGGLLNSNYQQARRTTARVTLVA